MRRTYTLPMFALGLVFGGGLLASLVQTSGDVKIKDVRFSGTGGVTMSALLYVPPNATPQAPAPGVLAIHGYINSRETHSAYAIELARRGYVVLALDQTGHGYSAAPAFANGYGGPDGLTYLRSLDIVDKRQVVLEGHSMGGWAVLIAAGLQRDNYRSIAISGSSTGTLGAPNGDAKFPRNLGVVYALYDEFSGLMWGSPIPRDVVETDKLKALFGTRERVQVEQLYGSVEAGTARKLYVPHQTHPWNHISSVAIGQVLDWVQATSTAPNALPPSDQIWQWKEFGTTLSLFGVLLLLFAVSALLLETPFWGSLREDPPSAHGASGAGYWIGVLLTLLIPIVLYVPVQEWAGEVIKPGPVLSQNLTTGLMCWALATGLISLGLFCAWHVASARRHGATARTYGLTWAAPARTGGQIAKTFLFALAVVGAGYLSLVLTDVLFKTDFRMWVVAAKPLAPIRAWIFLCYVMPFTAFFIVSGLVLHGQLRREGESLPRAMMRNALLTVAGFVGFMVLQYVPLFSGGTMMFPNAHLLTILGFQLLFVLPVTGVVSTYLFYRTGHVFAGAFVNGLFVTWLLVGGQATHHAF